MLLDKPLKLCFGAGNGVDRACLMTASNMLVGRGDLGDRSDLGGSCVCPLLRDFIIDTNDMMSQEAREKHYGPLAWEIIGTLSDDPIVLSMRKEELTKFAIRMLEICGSGLSTTETARVDVYLRTDAPYYAARVAAYVALDSSRGGFNSTFSHDEAAAECAAVIRRVAAIGDKRPVELAMTPEQLCAALS